LFACFPVYWMFVTTFKEVNDLYNLQNNPLLFHLPPTLEQVQYLFDKTNFATWVENTAEVGGAVVLITVLICVPAAYALARVRFPGSDSLGIGIFLTYLVPPTLLFLPLSQLAAGFGFNTTKWSLARRRHRSCPRGRVLLGFPAGRSAHRLVPGRDRLQPLYGHVRPRDHWWRPQIAERRRGSDCTERHSGPDRGPPRGGAPAGGRG